MGQGERRQREGQRGEGAENERRAKLTKWGGQKVYIRLYKRYAREEKREFEKTEEAEKTRRGYVLVGLQPAP